MNTGFPKKASSSPGNNRFSSRAILLDALKNAVHAITRTAPVGGAMNINTIAVRRKITLLATSVNIVHELIGPLVLYDTCVGAIVRP